MVNNFNWYTCLTLITNDIVRHTSKDHQYEMIKGFMLNFRKWYFEGKMKNYEISEKEYPGITDILSSIISDSKKEDVEELQSFCDSTEKALLNMVDVLSKKVGEDK